MARRGRSDRQQQAGAVEIERSQPRACKTDPRHPIPGQAEWIGARGAVLEPIVVVDHDQSAAGPQHAGRLAQDSELRVVDAIHDHGVETRGGERQRAWVAEPKLGPGEPRAVEARACSCEIVARARNCHGTVRASGKRGDDGRRAVAGVEQRIDRRLAELGTEHGGELPALLARVPWRLRRRRVARRAPVAKHVATFKVERERRITGIQSLDQHSREFGRRPGVGEPVVDPVLVTRPGQQSGVAEQLQVTRHPRLALTQHGRDVGNRQLPLGKKRQDSEPRRLGCRAQQLNKRGEELLHYLHI